MTLPQTPDDIPQAFAQAWAARDATALAELFAEDAEFVNVVGLWWHNRRDIERAHAYGLKNIFADSVLRPGGVRVRQLGAESVVVHCRWHLSGQRDPDGRLLEERSTIMVFVAQKTPQGWQVVTAQNTDVLPGQETLAVRDNQANAVSYRKGKAQ